MVLDEALEERILAILRRNSARWRSYSEEAMRAGNRKQAIVPEGATILEPVGTAPGLVVPPASGDGRDGARAARPAARAAADVGDRGATPALRAVLDRAGTLEQRMLRLYGVPEAEIARSLLRDRGGGRRARPARDHDLPAARGDRDRHACSSPGAAAAYDAFAAGIRARHGDTLFSEDGATIDEQVAGAARRAHDRGRGVVHGRADGRRG